VKAVSWIHHLIVIYAIEVFAKQLKTNVFVINEKFYYFNEKLASSRGPHCLECEIKENNEVCHGCDPGYYKNGFICSSNSFVFRDKSF